MPEFEKATLSWIFLEIMNEQTTDNEKDNAHEK